MKTITHSCDTCGKGLPRRDAIWVRMDLSYTGGFVFGVFRGDYCDYECARSDFDLIASGNHPKQQVDLTSSCKSSS
jgi:hypothetical protein